ncbi:MAG: hypothetical protein OEM59_00935 [Rhodospirillales bacterium]|nr:hypothetical protein [Rhodospirillales bacterium]
MSCADVRSLLTFTLAAAVAGLAWSGPFQDAQSQTWDWDKADRETLRLPPSAFPELPQAVAEELAQRGCRIPQVEPSDWLEGPHNVISGQFKQPGQTDWALLCSVDRVSSVLVFWNGSAENIEELSGGGYPDRNCLQGIGGGRIGFSCLISPVGEAYILEHREGYGGPEPPPIDHEGINEAFVGKISVVRYWYEGEWLKLQGAD